MKAAEGEQPPQEEIQLQPSQQITAPVAALKDDQAAVTPESPVQAVSFREEDDSSEDSSASAPAALQTPTQAPPPEAKDTDVVGGAASVPLPRGSATDTSSRTICLRTLRGSKSSGAISSLAGWGGVAVAAAAAAAATATATGVAAAAGEDQGSGQAGEAAGGGLGVLPTANKVVDLRQVKKVKPDPFEASAAAAAAAAAAAVAAAAASGAPIPDQLETLEEEAGGPVKIDISAGKRMIEFQLKQNAAEEKREAARLKSEKDRADAALAEESQRMLAQVNARMQAKRGGRGGLLGWGNEGLPDQVSYGSGGGASHKLGPNQVKTLAEKHGIVVRFVDDGAASGVAQVRALARAHGIRVQILGDGGGGDVGDEVEEEEEEVEEKEGHEVETPVGGRRALRVVGNESPTPPPVLSSLRSRAAPARRSPSPVPQILPKASGRKPPAAAAGGGMFSGPARMMRRALEASGGCVPSANEVSPAVTSRGGTSAPSMEARGPLASSSNSGVEKDTTRSNTAVAGDSSPAEPTLTDDAQQRSAKTTVNSNGSRVTSTGGTVRPRPASAESSGGADADSKGAKDGVAPTAVSRDGRLEGVRRRIGGGGNVAAAAAAAAASSTTGGSTGSLVGRKRREVPKDSSQEEGGGQRVATAERARPTRAMDGGGAAGGRMESRLGSRNTSSTGEEGARSESGRGSPETTSAGLPNSAPKRMRLVAPSGVVVSQATPSSQKQGRRTASGAGARGPGNNNLFKGAMAGIIGRGKRPAP